MALRQPKQQNENRSIVKEIAKQQAKKQGKKLAKKALKKGAKMAAKAVAKGAAALAKLLITGLSTVGLPVILIALGVIILIVVLSAIFSYFFSFGDDSLTTDERELHEYIVEQADSTVDMDNSFERQYRVSEQLISSVLQIEGMNSDRDEAEEKAKEIATSLAPEFYYGEFNEWTETKVQTCRDGECEPYSEIERVDNLVSKITDVEYWDGSQHWDYTAYITDWSYHEKVEYETEVYYEEKEVTRQEVIEVPHLESIEQEYEVEKRVKRTKKVPVEKQRVRLIPYPPFHYVETYIVMEEREYYETITETVCCRTIPIYTTKEQVITVTDTIIEEKTRQIEIITRTATRHQKFDVETEKVVDYVKFDNILNSFGYGINDKKLIDANYAFLDGESTYTEWLEAGGGMHYNNFGGFQGNIIPGNSIVPEYMEYYRGAEQKYGVDWYILASIHFHETTFSTNPTMISYAGAIGHMQFLPATWVGWKYSIGGGLVSPTLDITDLNVIRNGGGYGVDGDGDGKADPWNLADSIYTAAHYLSKSGYSNDIRGAIFAYNRANWYVNKVIATGEKFKNEATYEANGDIPPISEGTFMRPATGSVSSPFGNRSRGFHYGIDIGKNGRPYDVPIVASADGVVNRSYYSTSYGNVIYIKHNIDGVQYETLYAHLTNRAVREGQTVTKGQFLGNMGNTGRSTGPHLRLEIHSPSWNSSKSNALNPALYIPM